MTWKFNPFIQDLDYFENIFDVVSHTTNAVLTVGDLKQVHVMDCSTGNRSFTLPDIGATDVGDWVVLVRYNNTCTFAGTADPNQGNYLRIIAGGMDRILSSSPGGYIQCADKFRRFSSVFLAVMLDGQWGTPSFGIWRTY